MSYNQFTLASVTKTFNLITAEEDNIFAQVPEVKSSDYLVETLQYHVSLTLANNTEKARSELIIAPV